MTSILKTDEIQSQNGGAVVKMQTLKHPSASGNNLVLGSDGSATATLSSTSVVPASVGSSMVLIKTITSSAGDTEILFQHNYNGVTIDSTYLNYVLLVAGLTVTTNGKNVYLSIGNSSGYDTGNRGGAHYWYDNGSARGGASSVLTRAYTWDTVTATMRNNTANGGLQGCFNFFNFTNANQATLTTFQTSFYSDNGYQYGLHGGSTTLDAQAMDRIKFTTNSDSFQAGAKISLYGIKNA